ncbi:hypothetical protein C0J52_10703 [Blattella germanica]|nr:hypothetical protein C0J52_10703 [Blattella germanica]
MIWSREQRIRINGGVSLDNDRLGTGYVKDVTLWVNVSAVIRGFKESQTSTFILISFRDFKLLIH